MQTYRPTWAEIDLKALKYNFNAIKKIVSPKVKVMAVVKANAYGHGSVEVSKVLERERVDYLGVATLDEAITLRRAEIKSPILILGSVFPHEVETAAKFNITLTLGSYELLEVLKKSAVEVKVHVKIDTGMGRIGVWHEEAVEFIKAIKRSGRNIVLEGVYTHFSIAGRDKFFTQHQMDCFNNVIKTVELKNIRFKYKHAANSIAIIDWKNSHLNMIRPGIIIFGIYPKKSFPEFIKLKPVFSLRTKVSFVKAVDMGRSISYGRTFITQNSTRIATLPIGYADGYGRILSSKAKVLIRGSLSPVVGKVTMDQTMVDIGHLKDVKVGDDVVLIGKQRTGEIKIEELSRLAGTIPYEIVTGITSRVPRDYI